MRRFYSNHGEYHQAREFAEQSLSLANDTQDPISLVISHYSLAFTLFCLGELTDAHTHLERGIVLSENPENCPPELLIERVGTDIRLVCRITLASSFWLMGYPEQARKQVDAVLKLSQERSHTFAHAHSLCWAGFVYWFYRDVPLAQERAEELINLCREQKYATFGIWGAIQHGWALAMQGQGHQSIVQVCEGFTTLREVGQRGSLSPLFTILAEVHGTVGQTEEGLAVLDEAHIHVEQTGERYYEAEIYRLKGELLLQQSLDNANEADSCFHQAIARAQNQSAKSWELRAATSLARLWQSQNKCQDAYDLLAPIYNWFTEGFNTADLLEARALLDELEDGR